MQLNEVIRGQLGGDGGQMLIRWQRARQPAIQPATTILWPYVSGGCWGTRSLYMAGIAIFGNPFAASGHKSGLQSVPPSDVHHLGSEFLSMLG